MNNCNNFIVTNTKVKQEKKILSSRTMSTYAFDIFYCSFELNWYVNFIIGGLRREPTDIVITSIFFPNFFFCSLFIYFMTDAEIRVNAKFVRNECQKKLF